MKQVHFSGSVSQSTLLVSLKKTLEKKLVPMVVPWRPFQDFLTNFPNMLLTSMSASEIICKTIIFDSSNSHLHAGTEVVLRKANGAYHPSPPPWPQISWISWISDISFNDRFHRYQLELKYNQCWTSSSSSPPVSRREIIPPGFWLSEPSTTSYVTSPHLPPSSSTSSSPSLSPSWISYEQLTTLYVTSPQKTLWYLTNRRNFRSTFKMLTRFGNICHRI